MGASNVAVGWAGFIVSLTPNFGIKGPAECAGAPGTIVKLPDGGTVLGIINIPAALIIGILTIMLMLGTKESARVNKIIVGIKVLVVVAFILLGAGYIHTANWHPLVPENTGTFGEFGGSGVLRG